MVAAEAAEGGAGGTIDASALPKPMDDLVTDERMEALALTADGRGEAALELSGAEAPAAAPLSGVERKPVMDDSQPRTPEEGVAEAGVASLER